MVSFGQIIQILGLFNTFVLLYRQSNSSKKCIPTFIIDLKKWLWLTVLSTSEDYMTHNLSGCYTVSKFCSTPLKKSSTHFSPLTPPHLCLHFPQTAGQSNLLRLTSLSIWPGPGVQPHTKSISIQGTIFSGQYPASIPISWYPRSQCRKRLCGISVLDWLRKPNLCFMDSLSSLTFCLYRSFFLPHSHLHHPSVLHLYFGITLQQRAEAIF